MLTAGDEFGRSQQGNNNAYCQDNRIGWLDWERRDTVLEDFVADLARARATRTIVANRFPEPGTWRRPDEAVMAAADWEDPQTDGFTYRPAGPADSPALTVSRSGKSVRWG
jgi:glycogen operon protein